MKREQLKELELTDEQIDKIMALHGKDIEKHKTDLETANTGLEGLKQQLQQANEQIESFKGMDVEGIKKAADDWKVKAETAEAEAKKQIETLKFDHALDKALADAKAKNAKAVKALMQLDALKYNEADGSIVGLSDQLEKIKSDNDYLFESETKDPKIVLGGKSKTVTGDPFVIAAREAAGLPPPKE